MRCCIARRIAPTHGGWEFVSQTGLIPNEAVADYRYCLLSADTGCRPGAFYSGMVEFEMEETEKVLVAMVPGDSLTAVTLLALFEALTSRKASAAEVEELSHDTFTAE